MTIRFGGYSSNRAVVDVGVEGSDQRLGTVWCVTASPSIQLDSIKLDDPNGGVENWKLKMFQFWLQYQQDDPSWKDVIRALK